MMPANSLPSRHDYSEAALGATSVAEHVRVVVRVRPLNDDERLHRVSPCIQCPLEGGTKLEVTGGKAGRRGTRVFQADCVLDPFSSQYTVFEASGVMRLLNHSLAGYSGSVLAYGQTGSGKTYTMSGNEDDIRSACFADAETSGLIPRSMQYLMDRIRNAPSGVSYRLRASFLEIYNETPRDLLKASPESSVPPIEVRWNASGTGFFVENLRQVECHSVEDLMAVFIEGHRNRQVGGHNLNRDSSRSHCILAVSIESSVEDEEGNQVVRRGKISFVDLAGSERLHKTMSSGDQMVKEAGNINRSLFLLGKVISVLGGIHAGRKPTSTHVSYRDSLLTKLLMDSLGGPGMTLMIACCSPSSAHIEETLSTLNYAVKAQRITCKPRVDMDPQARVIAQQRAQIQEMASELDRLRQLLSSAGISSDPNVEVSSDYSAVSQVSTAFSNVDTNANVNTGTSKTGSRCHYPLVSTSSRVLPPLSPSLSSNAVLAVPGIAPGVAPGVGAVNSYPIPRLDITDSGTNEHHAAGKSRSGSGILNSMGAHIQNLLVQNSGLRDKNASAERQYYQVVKENSRLASKVENLERVFVDNDVDSIENKWEMRVSPSTTRKEQQELKLRNHILMSKPSVIRRNLSGNATNSNSNATTEQRELLKMRRENLQLRSQLDKALKRK